MKKALRLKFTALVILAIAAALALFLSSPSPAVIINSLQGNNIKLPRFSNYVAGQILVKFKPQTFQLVYGTGIASGEVSVVSPSIEVLKKKYGVYAMEGVVKRRPAKGGRMGIMSSLKDKEDALLRIYKLSFPIDKKVEDALNDFKNDPNVEYAEPNYISQVMTPNDPKYTDNTQWGPLKIHLTSTESGTSGWNYSRGSSEVVICILDTGVDYNHPDLAANIWINTGEVAGNGIDDDGNGFIDDVRGWDFVTYEAGQTAFAAGEDGGPRDNDPMDFYGHGTHCSGIASAVTDNAVGMAGVGWNCKIMAVRGGYAGNDGGGYLNEDDILQGLKYAADNGAHVISMSFGGGWSSFEADAIDYAYTAGCVLVAAAGNDNSSALVYPGAFEAVIAVVATDSNDHRASFSSYGTWTDISAPGVGIYSTLYSGVFTPKFTPTYASWSGTSMATPHVAGLAGLIKAQHPSWDNDTIRARIESTSDNIDSLNPGYAGRLGHGRINAYRALYPGPLLQTLKLSDRHSGSTALATDRVISVEAVGSSGDPTEEMISENSDFSGASWQAFRNPATFELSSGDENKTVYLKMRDAFLNVSPTYEASIILDIATPEISFITLKDRTNGDTIHTNERYVSVEAHFIPDNIISMKVSEDASFAGSSWQPFTATFEFYLPSAGEGTKEVFYKVRDIASRESNITSESIILDTSILGVTSITLRDRSSHGTIYTNERTIEVDAFNVIGTPVSMEISENADLSGATWLSYSNPATFEITSPSDGIKTVYYNLIDAGGATSELVSDSIMLDTLVPAVVYLEPAQGESDVSISHRILLVFNDTMEAGSVTLEVSPTLDLGSPYWYNGNTILVYYPPNKLKFSITYIITIETGARDKAGNLIGPYSWNFTTADQSTIEGTITSGITPLSGISVEFEDSQRNFIGAATTNSMGKFTMDGLADETYRVEPLAGGYEISTETIILSTGDKASADFNLSKAWPGFHLDRGKTGASPDTQIEPSLKFKWSYKFSDNNSELGAITSSPVISYGNVYIGSIDRKKIYCVDEATGTFKWSYDAYDGCAKSVTAAVGKVFVSDKYNYTYALDAQTGALVWQSSTYGGFNATQGPTYADGMVYVIGDQVGLSNIYCLDAQTGVMIWWKNIPHTYVSPVVKDGMVYVVSTWSLFALDAKTGQTILWGFPTSNYVYDWKSMPSLAGDSFYSSQVDGYVYALNKNTGTPKWSFSTNYDSMYSTPVIDDGTIYFGRGTLRAVNASDGSLKWSKDLPSAVFGSAALAGGVLYLGSGDNFIGIDAVNGALKWSYSVATSETYNNAEYASPAIVDGTLFAATKNGYLLALAPDQAPDAPASLAQYQYMGGAPIALGGDSLLTRLVLKFSMTDPDPYGTLTPEVEIRPISQPFTGIPNFTGTNIPHATSAVTGVVTAEGLMNLEDYHWQARVVDEYGMTSGWSQFNGGGTAFRIYDIVSPELIATDPTSNETGVSTFADIKFVFSEPMDGSSVARAFSISPSTEGAFLTLPSGSTMEAFRPTTRLIGKTVYAVTLEGNATDEAGNTIGVTNTFTFETAAGKIEGIVTIPGFGGAGGAVIEASRMGSTKATAATNAVGFYSINNLAEGPYTVQALVAGRSIGTQFNVIVTAETTTTINFNLDQAWPLSLQDRENSKTNSDAALNPPLKPKWSFSASTGNYFSNSSAIENGKVFALGDDFKLYAINLSSGTLLWSHAVNGYAFAPPSAFNNMVYVTTSRNPNPSPPPDYGIKLYAFAQSDGSLEWSSFVPGPDTSTGSVINNGDLYIGAYNYLFCFDLQNHSLRWSYDAGTWMSATPAIYNNHIYLATWSDLQAVDLETRTLKWSVPFGASGYGPSSPSIANGTLYVGNHAGTLFSVNASTGGINWSYDQVDRILLSPLASGDKVYFGAGSKLYSLDRSSGGLLWSRDLGELSATSPVLINGTIYIGAADPYTSHDRILALSPLNGQILWSYQTSDYIYSTFSGSNGTLIVGMGDNHLRAFVSSSEVSTTPPVITSGPQAVNIGTDEATIIWQTDELGNYIVDWGRTQSYGSSISMASFVTDHTVTLEGLTDNALYHFRVGSKDELGNGPTYSGDNTFTTGMVPGKFYSYPAIDVLVNGIHLQNGDIISSRPEITVYLTGSVTLDIASAMLIIDNITAEGVLATVEAETFYRLSYSPQAPLATENIAKHTIRASISNTLGYLSVWERNELRVLGGKSLLVGEPLTYPSVFKPLSGAIATFAYTLTSNADISLYMYDVGGRIILTKKFNAGLNGGRAGYNSFTWNGRTDFGRTVGNGIYVYKMLSGKKIIGTGKLVVYD